MKLLKVLFGVTYIFAGCAVCVPAEDPSGGTVKTRLSFMLVAGAQPVKGAFYIWGAGERARRVEVSAGTAAKSTLTDYEGSRSLAIYAPSLVPTGGGATPAGAGKPGSVPPPTPIAKVSLPQAEQCLVLLAPGQTSQGIPSYSALAVPDDWKGFPAGCLRFLNFSGAPLIVEVGNGARLTLGKGISEPLRLASPNSSEDSYKFLITTADASPKLVYQNEIKLSGSHRMTVVLVGGGPSDKRRVSGTLVREMAVVPHSPVLR
jgi:hypothetical protein